MAILLMEFVIVKVQVRQPHDVFVVVSPMLLCFFGPVSAGKQELLFWDARKEHECGRNFRWRTPVKMADNNQNLKGFLYSNG